MSPRTVTADQARALLDGATTGPWQWYGDTASRSIYLSTVDRGRQFVLSFWRWGMQGATPAFRGDGQMQNAAWFARYEVAPDATSPDDPRLYRHDFLGLRHPDAELIAAAPDLAHTVVRQAEDLAALTALVREWGSTESGELDEQALYERFEAIVGTANTPEAPDA